MRKLITNKALFTPISLLILMSIAMPVAFNAWSAMLNNFVVEKAAFTGVEIGILQSLREVPGFLSFTLIFVLLILKEQTFAVLSLALSRLGSMPDGIFSNCLWPLLYYHCHEHWFSLLRGDKAVLEFAMVIKRGSANCFR